MKNHRGTSGAWQFNDICLQLTDTVKFKPKTDPTVRSETGGILNES